MFWSDPSTIIIVVTDREKREPIRTLLSQLQRIGYEVHVLTRVSYETTNRIPMPQVVMIDAAWREFQSSGAVPSSIRGAWEYVPLIMLAGADEMSRLRFAPSMQDFLLVPSTVPELEARVRFALVKTQRAMPSRDMLEVGSLRMNLATYEVWASNRKIDLTYKEFELLKFLVTHQRRVYTRPELLETIWESDYYGGTRTVDVHIRRLRAKLGSVVGDLIHTVRNVGYRFG